MTPYEQQVEADAACAYGCLVVAGKLLFYALATTVLILLLIKLL